MNGSIQWIFGILTKKMVIWNDDFFKQSNEGVALSNTYYSNKQTYNYNNEEVH